MSRKVLTLAELTSINKRIKENGGIGNKTIKLPSVRNDIIEKTNRKSMGLIKKISNSKEIV